LHVLTIS